MDQTARPSRSSGRTRDWRTGYPNRLVCTRCGERTSLTRKTGECFGCWKAVAS